MSAASHPITAPAKQQPTLAPKPVPTRPESGRPWKWLVVLGIVAVVAYFAYQAMNKPAAPATPIVAAKTAKVTVGNLARIMRVAGQTAAIDFANIVGPIMQGPEANREMILLSTATPGSWVTKGTLVAAIDAQSMQDHVDDLGDTIEAAQADIRKRKAEHAIELENLQQNLRLTKAEADKARLDAKAAEVRTEIERQLLKLSMDEADARFKQAESDLEIKKVSHAADIKILELTLERHTRHRNRHINDVKSFSIRAPMDGLVVMSQLYRGGEMQSVQQGDRVFAGQKFMSIVNTKSMQMEGRVNQSETGDFRIGQQATIKFDAFPGMQFKGTVHTIGALAGGSMMQSAYVRTVPIRLRIEGNDPRLIPDLSASADVVVDKAEGKVLAPRAAISMEDGKAFAYVKKGETFEKRELTLGLQNDTQAVVVSGLNSGEEVRLN
jgi:HlyD family secretion protein